MLTILVANLKGGCGKTTVATNLAAAFAQNGRKTVIADADKQGSSKLWVNSRPSHVPAIEVIDWAKKISAVPKEAERLVIDSPAAIRRGMLDNLIERADIVVVPIMPSVFDHGAAGGFLRKLKRFGSIKKGRKEVALIGNRIRPRTRAAHRLEDYLSNAGWNVVTLLRDTQLYPEAAAHGLGLYDLHDSRTALFRRDWDPLIAYIEEGVL